MRRTVCGLCLLMACADQTAGEAGRAQALPVLLVHPMASESSIVIDGSMADPAWKRILPVKIALDGVGVQEVQLKAAYDADRIYLIAIWPDETLSTNRYWEYVGPEQWRKHTGEDGFALCWSPGALSRPFREQGCALFCHDGRHRHAQGHSSADFWYWGAQTTGRKSKLRDMWLPFGKNQRLRGDQQPARSDNIFNKSEEYEGPWGVPLRVGPRRSPFYLDRSNTQPLPRERLRKLGLKENLGWKVALDIQQPMRGSRGDVQARGRHLAKAYVLEMVRNLSTGHRDDQPLIDTGMPLYFSVAIYENSEQGGHTISGPIELRFVPRP